MPYKAYLLGQGDLLIVARLEGDVNARKGSIRHDV